MAIKTTRPYFTAIPNARRGDEGSTTFILRTSKREAAKLLRRGRYGTRMTLALEHALLDRDLIQTYGCECSHCAHDWDCCGRLFPATVHAQRVRGGIRITQSYQRNV